MSIAIGAEFVKNCHPEWNEGSYALERFLARRARNDKKKLSGMTGSGDLILG